MTVIAWDGTTLAADKQMTGGGGIKRTVRKIYRHGGMLIGITGNVDVALEMLEWFKAAAKPADFPAKARDDVSTLVVISRDGVRSYNGSPYALMLEDKKVAFGSGRDFAETAMFLGCDARRAVEVTCHFQSDCGNGIDTLTLEST